MNRQPLILASTSPRRHELIAALGLSFEILPPQTDEQTTESDPARMTEELALRKAYSSAAARADGRAVIGADTVVVLHGRVLGKPANAQHARETLASLRGRTHQVITGIAVLAGRQVVAEHVTTAVTMRLYSDTDIDRAVADGRHLDKAGGYAIQDREFAPVERCDGCECSVIGLPLWTLRRLLRIVAGIECDEPKYDRCSACPLRKS